MAEGSEKISAKWVEGAQRVCVRCGAPIANLSRDVGEVRSCYVRGREVSREIVCMTCHVPARQ